MGRRPCSRLSMSRPARFWASTKSGAGASNSLASWTRSLPPFPTASFTSCWIISIPTRRTSVGSRSIPQSALPFHPNASFLAQSDRDMVLHPSGPIAQRRFFHRRLPTTGAYGCLHQRLERKRRALRLDQEKGPPTPLQRQAYHSTLIPGTSRAEIAKNISEQIDKRLEAYLRHYGIPLNS